MYQCRLNSVYRLRQYNCISFVTGLYRSYIDAVPNPAPLRQVPAQKRGTNFFRFSNVATGGTAVSTGDISVVKPSFVFAGVAPN